MGKTNIFPNYAFWIKFIEFKNSHTIPRYGELVSIDFPMYENIFSQLMDNWWEYPYLSYWWILRDFACDAYGYFQQFQLEWAVRA